MKYETQLQDVKNQLSQAQNVAILLPSQLSTDRLAAGLSLMLALKAAGKSVVLASEGTPTVASSHLFGVGEVRNNLSNFAVGGGSGQYTLSLENVVAADGTVPALEKLDWYPEGANLNLVFHVAAGQKFEPTNIKTQSAQGAGNPVYFVIGASNVNDLGGLYGQNANQMLQAFTVNIDVSPNNGNFGKANIVDANASSVSEMVAQILLDLGLTIDQDIASNIVAGIYEATSNLTTNVKGDTFTVVGQAMQAGAQMPGVSGQSSVVSPQPAQQTPFVPTQPDPAQSQPQVQPQPQAQSDANGFDMSVFNTPAPQANPQPMSQMPFMNVPPAPQPTPPAPEPVAQNPAPAAHIEGTVITPPNTAAPSNFPPFMQAPVGPTPTQNNQPTWQAPSPEERPSGEFAVSHNPETAGNPAPDWLTPKIFKGSAN